MRAMIFKKPFLRLGVVMVGVFSVPVSVSAAVSACTPDEGLAILQFPHWYRGLQCEDSGNGGVVFTDLGDIWTVVANVLNMAIQAAGLIAVFMIIYGGIRYITSQGVPDNIETAKKTITYAIAGLVLAILASTLVGFIAGQF